MTKNVFLFPGQGSQEVGMARDLFQDDDYLISLIKEASQIVNEDLKRLCLRGPEKKLTQARFLQPLIVAVSLGYLRRIEEKGIKADLVLGHSLGEISALAASGVITPSLAIAISAKRGELMDEVASSCNGGMMAVFSVSPQKIEKIIDELELKDKVVIANDNTPDQIVISGDKSSFDILSKRIVEEGGRSKRLNVCGPWHSPYLKGARKKFEAWAEKVEFNKPRTPILFNATANLESDPLEIKKLITLQLSSPVYFRQCMQYCKSKRFDSFLEIGPGRILSGLVRANGFMQDVRIYNVNNLKGVEMAASEIFS